MVGEDVCWGDSVIVLRAGETRECWLHAMVQEPMNQFVTCSEVADVTSCLFLVVAEGSQTTGAVPADAKVVLQHKLTGLFVCWEKTETGRRVTMKELPECGLGLRKETQGDRIADGERVSIQTEAETGLLSLNSSFEFVSECADTFLLRRFSAALPSDSFLSYSQPVTLQFGRWFLSVLPKSAQSGRIAIREEDQCESFLTESESKSFPEYDGDLKPDLNSNGKDWNNCWIVERSDMFLGGTVALADFFLLKHIASGKYLTSEFRLAHRDAAGQFQFHMEGEDSTSVPCGKPLGFSSSEGVSVVTDRTPVLSTLRSQMFLPQTDGFSPSFRTSIVPKQKEGDSLVFTVEKIAEKDAALMCMLALYQTPLSMFRSTLQNVMKVSDVDTEVMKMDRGICLKAISLMGANSGKCAEIAVDFQLLNELIRILTLAKITKGLFAFNLRSLSLLTDAKSTLSEFGVNRRTGDFLLAQSELLSPIVSVSPFTIAKLLLAAVKQPICSLATHLSLLSLFTTLTSELKSYDNYINLSSFLSQLLLTLPCTVTIPHIPALVLGGEFVLRLEAAEGSLAVWSFGVQRKVAEVGEKLSAFVGEMLKLAAALCVNGPHREKIIAGMGLSLDFLVEAFADCQERPNMQIGILTVIALVHVPDAATGQFPLTQLLETDLINETGFLESALAQEHRSDLYSFSVPDSSLVNLLKFEVNLWLCELLSQVRTDSELWYRTLSAHLLFVTKLVAWRCVSDAFVAMTHECISAVLKDFVITATEDPTFLLWDKAAGEKMAFLGLFWDYVETVQLWKLFRVTQELIVNEEFSLVPERISYLLSSLEPAAVLRQYVATHSNPDDQTVLQAMRILINNPETDGHSLLVCLMQGVPVLYGRRKEQIDAILSREGNMGEWVREKLGSAAEEGLNLPFLVMVRGVREYGDLGRSDEALEEICSAMESLSDVLGSLSAPNLANFQAILQKAGFRHALRRLWTKAGFLEGTELPIGVEFISLVLDITLLYVRSSEANRSEVSAILADSVCFLDYPQYIRLLLEMQLLKQESVSGVILLLVQFAQVTNFKRPILALEALMSDRSLLPIALIVISTLYSTIEKPALSAVDWEVIITTLTVTPVAFRASLFEKVIVKWYEKEPAQIRREGAALLTFAGETANPLFHSGLLETISHIEQALTAEYIAEAHFKLCSYGRIQRARNCELAGSDVIYVLELLWNKTAGVVAMVPEWMERISLQDVAMQLARLYLCLPEVDALKDRISLLANTLRLYVLRTDDPLEDDDRDFLLTVCLKEVGPFDSEDESSLQIKSPRLLFSLNSI